MSIVHTFLTPNAWPLSYQYIRWIEETYPSLGAASKYRSVLYRCVKENCRTQGVHNHPIYVDTWLKLINYCDSASELFNLLFHKGVGTLNTDFYIAWAEHIQRLPEKSLDSQSKKWARIASIFAHGLRAGAKPHYLLEDKAERFIASVKRAEHLAEEKQGFEKLISEQQCVEKSTKTEERQTLAQLRTLDAEGGPSIVPKVRTGAAINPEPQGLRGLKPQIPNAHPQKPRSRFHIFCDPTPSSDLPNLSAAQSAGDDLEKPLARIAEPISSWNVENVKAPCVRLDRKTASTLSSRSGAGSSKQPLKLRIFKDTSEEADGTSESSKRPQSPAAGSQRTRGLRLAGGQGLSFRRSPSDHIFSLANLRSALPGEEEEATFGSREEATQEEEANAEFFADIDALNIHGQEINFEMRRKLAMLKSSSSPPPSSPEEKTAKCFSLNLDDPISRSVVEDIERIVSGEYEESEGSFSQAEQIGERNDCAELIKQLEAIVTKYDGT
ncbi:hypothetical protein Aperf_G00000129890 [Anoplocephala perfoliata]